MLTWSTVHLPIHKQICTIIRKSVSLGLLFEVTSCITASMWSWELVKGWRKCIRCKVVENITIRWFLVYRSKLFLDIRYICHHGEWWQNDTYPCKCADFIHYCWTTHLSSKHTKPSQRSAKASHLLASGLSHCFDGKMYWPCGKNVLKLN